MSIFLAILIYHLIIGLLVTICSLGVISQMNKEDFKFEFRHFYVIPMMILIWPMILIVVITKGVDDLEELRLEVS